MSPRRLRALIAAGLAACIIVGVPAAPARSAPHAAGDVIDVIDRPAGWRDLANGRAITYWTQDPLGHPIKASGALFVPTGTAPAGGWPVVAYTHGTTGYGPGCGGQSFADAKPNRFISRLVQTGYAVVAPDYVGLGPMNVGVHPYLNNRSEATATIDLFTAAREVDRSLSTRWAVMGESQGGHAALATAHMASSYGPRTDFRGAVALDPVSSWSRIFPLLTPNTPKLPEPVSAMYDFVFGALAGMRAWDPSARIDSYLTPLGRRVLASVGTTCRPSDDYDMRIGEMFSRSLNTPQIVDAFARYMGVAVDGYRDPILLLINRFDVIVATPLHDLLKQEFTAHRVDFDAVEGSGMHTAMDDDQWQAFDEFFARLR